MTKPRILVADDHAEMRSQIVALLASEFDVAAAVADGEAAVKASESLRPELIVMDISMPVLSGLDAAARIRNQPQAPRIVFLSTFDAREFVDAALSLGASGFVPKHHMTRELIPAVRRALRHFHSVYFYEDEPSLSRVVARFIGEGLNASEPALLIGTLSHATAVLGRLSEMGFDPQKQIWQENLVVLDANDLLSRLLVDGMPSNERFEDAMVPILDRMAGADKRAVRAYGEMVDLLWNNQSEAAALSLEMQWNRLAMARDFSLLCGYLNDGARHGEGAGQIGALHSHVVSEN